MTALRRKTVLIRDAKILLESAGYDVVIVPELSLQHWFQAHLIAFHGNTDVRYIWIKIAIKPFVCLAEVEKFCANEIREIRKQLARHTQMTRFHCEIRVATADGRFQCYEVSSDAFREIFPCARDPIRAYGGSSCMTSRCNHGRCIRMSSHHCSHIDGAAT